MLDDYTKILAIAIEWFMSQKNVIDAFFTLINEK